MSSTLIMLEETKAIQSSGDPGQLTEGTKRFSFSSTSPDQAILKRDGETKIKQIKYTCESTVNLKYVFKEKAT